MILLILLFSFPLLGSGGPERPQYISDLTFIGSLKTIQYEVRGDVYAKDHHTIVIKDFHFNGDAMDAVFWAGESSNLERMMDTVILTPDGNFYTFFSSTPFLEAYHGEDVTLSLPERINVEDLEFLTVWSKFGARDLGFLTFPDDVQIPIGDEDTREPKRIEGEEEEEDDDDYYVIPINFDDDTDNVVGNGDEDYTLTLNQMETNIAELERNLAKMKKDLSDRRREMTGDSGHTADALSTSSCLSLLTLAVFVLIILN